MTVPIDLDPLIAQCAVGEFDDSTLLGLSPLCSPFGRRGVRYSTVRRSAPSDTPFPGGHGYVLPAYM